MTATTAATTKTPSLPKSWREVCSNDGEVLYWRREHSGYEVHPQGALGPYGHVTRYRLELDGAVIGEIHDTLKHAIVAAREHMYASYNNGDQKLG